MTSRCFAVLFSVNLRDIGTAISERSRETITVPQVREVNTISG